LAVDLYSLLKPPTPEAVFNELVALLQASGFPTTSWSTRSVPVRLLRAFAKLYSLSARAIAFIAGSGFVGWADDDWLDLLGEQFFDEPRQQAIAARHSFRLTDSGGGPHTITVSAVVVTSSTGQVFRNLGTGTVVLNGLLDVVFVADVPGSAGNIPSGDTLTLTTSFPGLTVTNPGSSILTAGAERELDEAYARRLREKWGSISSGMNDDFYIFWAKKATGIGRVKVRQAYPLPGQVTVVVAGASGPVSALPTLSAVTQTGSGPTVTYEGTPFGDYRARMEILTGGALATATARITLDGGETFLASFTLPNPGYYLIPDTGLLMTLAAGTYVAGTSYEFGTQRSPVAVAQAIFQSVFGTGICGQCIDVFVVAATEVAIAVAGTVTCKTGKTGAAQAEGTRELQDLQATLDLGATIYRAELIQRIMDADGTINAVLSSPGSDWVLGAQEVATLDISGLSWV